MKNKYFGMTIFQIGILFFLGIIACGVIGTGAFMLINDTPNTKIFSKPEDEILGKWQTDKGVIYEFFPDGTLSASGLASKYSFPDEAHIKIDTGNLSVVMEYTISKNELVLINRNPIIKTSDEPYVLNLKRIE